MTNGLTTLLLKRLEGSADLRQFHVTADAQPTANSAPVAVHHLHNNAVLGIRLIQHKLLIF